MRPWPRRSPWRSRIPRRATSAAAASWSSIPAKGKRRPSSSTARPPPPPPPRPCSSKDESGYGHKVVGVPGTVRGMALAHQKLRQAALEDARRCPRSSWPRRASSSTSTSPTRSTSILPDGEATSPSCSASSASRTASTWQAGDRLVQPDLAKTLRLIAEQGPDAFYTGPIADQIVAEMKAGGGLITKDDLAGYQADAAQADPRHLSRLRRLRPAAAQLRRHLPGADAQHPGELRPEEARPLVARDAAPDGRGDAPRLLRPRPPPRRSRLHQDSRAPDDARSTPRSWPTSIDLEQGDAAARTWPRTSRWPARATAPRTSPSSTRTAWRSPTPTRWSTATARASSSRAPASCSTTRWSTSTGGPASPTARAPSAPSPTRSRPASACSARRRRRIVAKDGKVVLVTGSPGGRTIINTVLQHRRQRDRFRHGRSSEAVDAPRLHHQWFPDEMRFERCFGASRHGVKRLRAMGHRVVPQAAPGRRPFDLGESRRRAATSARGPAPQRQGRGVLRKVGFRLPG